MKKLSMLFFATTFMLCLFSVLPKTTNATEEQFNTTPAVAAGYKHTLALKSDGKVFSWGINAFGRLGDGTISNRTTPVQVIGENNEGYLSQIIAVAAGYQHSAAVSQDGTIWTWGITEAAN